MVELSKKNTGFRGNASESDLEMFFIAYQSLKCPLDSSKARSLGKLFANQSMPKFFRQLKRSAETFHLILIDKNSDHSYEDCITYLAWKIWQFKIKNIDSISSPIARAKAQLMNDKAIDELHKSASRIKREAKEIREICSGNDNDEVKDKLDKLLELVESKVTTELETYKAIFDNHQKCIRAVEKLNILEG